MKGNVESIGLSQDYLDQCTARMAEIDALPADVRAIVHEYGWTVVKQFLVCGVTKSKHIRHLIVATRAGSGAYGNGTRSEHMRVVTVPASPSDAMITASIAALPIYDGQRPLIGIYEKHRIRLVAALGAGAIRSKDQP